MARVATAPKLSYRIDEACAATGLSRPTLYRLIERGELRTFKVGTRTLIMASVLEGFVERRLAAAAANDLPPPNFPRTPVVPICGVYLLFLADRLSYIGRSVDIQSRLSQHRASGRAFDQARIIPCDEATAFWLEPELIRTLRPSENIRRYERRAQAAARALSRAGLK